MPELLNRGQNSRSLITNWTLVCLVHLLSWVNLRNALKIELVPVLMGQAYSSTMDRQSQRSSQINMAPTAKAAINKAMVAPVQRVG